LWNDEALQGAFAAAWARLAFALRDAPAVFAYDVLNEPFWGTGHPDRFDRCVAPRFYARVIEAIRAVDPRPWIAIEPAAIASTGWRSSFLAPRRERLLFAPHLYPPAVELGIGWPGDRAALDRHVARLAGTAANAGLPWLAGEVGVRREVPGAVQYLEEALDALDVAHAGFFHWDLGRSASGYALWEEDGSPSALARALARAQPVRIAGEPIRWHWDRDARRFELEWNEDGSASGETIVAVPTLAFPDGFVAHLDDGAPSRVEGTRIHVSQSGGTRRLQVVPPGSAGDARSA